MSGCWESRTVPQLGGKGWIFPGIREAQAEYSQKFGKHKLNIPRDLGSAWGAGDRQDTSISCWEELEQIQPDTAQTLKNPTPPALPKPMDSLF